MTKAALLLGLLLPCACSSSSPAGAGGNDASTADTATGADSSEAAAGTTAFVGTWNCTATAPLVVTAPPSLAGTYTPSSDAYVLSIAASTATSLTVLIEGLDGGVFCTKTATLTGSTADFTGQTCPLVFSGTTLTETFTSGTFAVNGNTMTDVGTGSVAGTIPVDGGTSPFAATTAFNGTCTK